MLNPRWMKTTGRIKSVLSPLAHPDLEDIPDYEEMEEVAEPRGPHADFYDHE